MVFLVSIVIGAQGAGSAYILNLISYHTYSKKQENLDKRGYKM